MLRKNMVGAFHQPALVVCDVAALESLPDDELACGLAECVKHALIGAEWGDPGLMEFTTAGAARFLARERAALSELVARNVVIKAGVVAGDEREERADGKGRMCLNMGHTVGHAIETMDVHAVIRGTVRRESGLKHGEAVALGLIAEAACGEQLGTTRAGLAGELTGLFGGLGLPTHISDIPEFAAVAAAMQNDKKVGGGQVRLAVPTGRGTCEIIRNPAPAALRAGIGAIRT